MNGDNRYEKILIKYLVDELSSEDKAFVEEWIQSNEQNRAYFEELRNVWNLTALKNTIGKIKIDDEWNQFKHNILIKNSETTHPEQGEEKTNCEEITKQYGRSIRYRIIVRIAVAASILLLIGLGWKFRFFVNDKAKTTVASSLKKKTDSLTFTMRHEINTSGHDKRIQLADGSLVVLTNNSEITFREPFVGKRDIALTGKAYFKVAKDKTRPFTVASGDILTTAVGTEFSVTAIRNAHQIIVRLYEGKVVVKASDPHNGRMKNDIYLLPGQQLIYGDQTTVKVEFFKVKIQAPEESLDKELPADNPAIPENVDHPYFMFNDQSLSKVLDNLAAIYNVKIIYNKNDVQEIYWTGKYDRSESLETILKRIGKVHGLLVTRQNNDTYIIKSK
jgi:ferric-dicitrate binding protein FerR (iron transport regulator)